MNNTQKERLERNLSKAASGAKPFWPRVLIGPEVEKQGYIDPKLLPIHPNMNLGQFYDEFLKYKEETDKVIKKLQEKNEMLEVLIKELTNKHLKLLNRIRDLEGFSLD